MESIPTLETLIGDPMNPRVISKEEYAKLKTLLEKFGDLSGVIRNVRTDQLVGGHMRTEAFKESKAEKTITITQRYESPTAAGTVAIGHVVINGELFAYREVDWDEGTQRAANLAANKAGGKFDNDALAQVMFEISQLENGSDLLALTAFAEDEISKLLDSVGVGGAESADDDAPEVDEVNPPLSREGEVYQLGPHRLMCGSATDMDHVTTLMDGKLADMIFTDPPYNVAYEGKTADALTIQNDSMNDADFYQFLLDAYTSMAAVTKAGGSIYVCHADSEGMNFRKGMLDAGFLLKQCIIWVKQSMVMGRQDYQWQHEPILYGWKDGASHFFIDDRTQTTVWEVDRPSRNAEHPTMKPIALCARAIMNSSVRDQLVIDFFGGSGSTLMAAEETGRACNTMELDPRYADVIRKRYAIHIGAEDWASATPVVATAPAKAPAPAPSDANDFMPPELPTA
jgi:DNA modification methylase